MPIYDYECSRCGPFSDFRPLADYAAPAVCPGCNSDAPRAYLSVPAMIIRGASSRVMMADDASRATRRSSFRHGAACGCGCGNRLKIRREDWVRKLL